MNIRKDFKQLPSSDCHYCFACSPVNPSGLRMKFFTDEKAVFSHVMVPTHLCGWNKLAHGGIVSTILDEIMSWAALYLLKQIILTQSMTVEFIKPVPISTVLEAKGRVLERSGRRDVVMEGFIYNSEGNICARSAGTYKVFSPEVAMRLGIADDASLAWFESLINMT